MYFITWNPSRVMSNSVKNVKDEEEYTHMAKMNETLYLPSELIIQILLRLSVKSLLRFKCVCKSWFSLISDPHFANSHADVSAARIVLISRTPTPVGIRSIDFETSINHDSISLDHPFLLPRSYCFYEIKGSCRGFYSFTLFNKPLRMESIF